MLLRHARTFASRAGKRSDGAISFGQRGPKRSGSPVESAVEKKLINLLRPVAPPPPKSAEEKARLRELMIRFGKMKRRQHLEQTMKMNRFLWAKWAAIDALPNARRIEALNTAQRDFPINRPLWTDTPPIKGFNSGAMTKS